MIEIKQAIVDGSKIFMSGQVVSFYGYRDFEKPRHTGRIVSIEPDSVVLDCSRQYSEDVVTLKAPFNPYWDRFELEEKEGVE